MLIGHIDAFERSRLYGWAFNPEDAGEHLHIQVHSGNDVVAEGIAKLPRKDLPEAGIGTGDHAFELMVPPHIKSVGELVVTAQSVRHGDIVLPMLDKDNQQLNTILQIYSSRYNAALRQLKSEINEITASAGSLRQLKSVPQVPVPTDIETRLNSLEQRIDSVEIFLVRIDTALLRLVEAQKHKRRWGFSRMFKPGNG